MPSTKKPDIWMPLYIGDYLADTSHLDAERHGCYLLWMMHYWRKGPLSDNLSDLISVGKLRSQDAPSIAQALLNEFFVKNGDGRWHQKRVDAEMDRWNSKSLKAKEKAQKAAAARWEQDATSNAPRIPTSNAQAMLEICPSPSPLPIKEQKPSRGEPRAKKSWDEMKHSTDPRHRACQEAIFSYYQIKNDGEDPDWEGREGKSLAMFLRANPKLTAEGMGRLLAHRADSEVNHSERPSLWISKLTSFRMGALDKFGKPLSLNGNGHQPAQPKLRILSAPGVE